VEHVREEQLALYAWGDLPPQENSAVASHVGSCGQCQKVLAEFHEARSFVISALQNPGANELSEMRTRLTASLQLSQSSERRWAWWGAGVAAALALFILPHSFEKRPVVMKRAKPVVAPSLLRESINSGPTLRIPLTPIAASRPRHLRPQKAGIRTITLITQADQEPMIKMTTADPNVVILWQSDDKAEYKP
jgi:hypothetical protein